MKRRRFGSKVDWGFDVHEERRGMWMVEPVRGLLQTVVAG
jgi:hypothetical protein